MENFDDSEKPGPGPDLGPKWGPKWILTVVRVVEWVGASTALYPCITHTRHRTTTETGPWEVETKPLLDLPQCGRGVPYVQPQQFGHQVLHVVRHLERWRAEEPPTEEVAGSGWGLSGRQKVPNQVRDLD